MGKWTARDIADQAGRTFVVTGANSGLGAETARALGAAGATVVLACRDVDKAAPIAAHIGPNARVRRLDLADLTSIRTFAADLERVDVLINNAGVMAVPQSSTADGFEMQFGTNHLGHFALTGLLLDRITDRVVTMSSLMHQIGAIHLDDLNWQHRQYHRWPAYGQSKLANLMFAYELDRRLAAAGSSVTSVAAHPGYAATGLHGHTQSLWGRLMSVGNLFAQTAAMGALPELYAATVGSVPSGTYIGPGGPFEQRGYPKVVDSSGKSHNRAVAASLWAESERLTDVVYRFEAARRA